MQKGNHDEFCGECKELNDWSSCIDDYIWNLSTWDCEYNKTCKIDEYLFFKNCSCEKGLLNKLLLICKDEILNTTETSLDNKLVVWRNNRFIHTILLVITCSLLLVIVSIGCYYFYKRYWKKVYIAVLM